MRHALRAQGVWDRWISFRLLVAVVLALLATGVFTARSAQAYPCITRNPSAGTTQGDDRCRPERRTPKIGKHSSFAELAFAGGMVIAILLLPLVPKNLDALDEERARRGRF